MIRTKRLVTVPQKRVEVKSDWLLHSLSAVAKTGVGCPVTLHIGGFLLCGTLCTEADWLEDLDRRLHAGIPGPEHKPIADGLAEVLKESVQLAEKSTRGAFLHLSGAHWVGPGGSCVPANPPGTHCRVRLSEVSAWSLEKMEPAEYEG